MFSPDSIPFRVGSSSTSLFSDASGGIAATTFEYCSLAGPAVIPCAKMLNSTVFIMVRIIVSDFFTASSDHYRCSSHIPFTASFSALICPVKAGNPGSYHQDTDSPYQRCCTDPHVEYEKQAYYDTDYAENPCSQSISAKGSDDQ